MRAVVLHRDAQLAIEDVPAPQPRANEILIQLAAASVNPIDLLMRERYGESLFKWLRPKGPHLLGLDGAGVVTAAGAQVRNFQPGDRVMAAAYPYRSGFYAESIAVPAAWASKAPDKLSLPEAASLPYAGLTMLQALDAAGLGPVSARGRRVLVHGGAGGIGGMLLQLLHAWGAWVATTCRRENFDEVIALGADQAIDYRSQDFTREIGGLDVVFNTVAPKEPRLVEAPHLSVLRSGGIYVSLISPTLTLADALGAPLGLMASGAWMGGARLRWALAGKRHRWVYFRAQGGELARIKEWIAAGWLRPRIARMLPLEAIGQAHALIGEGGLRGKLVLTMGGGCA